MKENQITFFKIVGAAVAVVTVAYLLRQFVTLTISVPQVRIDVVVETTPHPTVARPTSTAPEPTVTQPAPSPPPAPTKEIESATPQGDPGQKEPVAYYPFDGNANDESGNGHHGTVHGATLTTDRFGNQDDAYLFDGRDDYIALPDNLDLLDIDFTLSAWIKPDDYGIISSVSRSCARRILSYRAKTKSNGHPTNSGISFVLNEAGGCGGNNLVKVTFIGQDFQYNGITCEYDVTDWFLFTVTRESENIVLYINGAEMSRQTVSPYAVFENPSQPRSFIGAQWSDVGFNFPFDGVIDDVRVYNRALSAVEVERLYQLGQ